MRRPELSRHPSDAPLPTADRSDVGSAAIAGARSYAGTRLLVEVVNFASLIVLARLVAPAQFGYAAVALVVPQLAEVLAYEGFGSYLVRNKDATWGDARSVVALCLTFCGALTVIVAVLAPLTTGLFGQQASDLIRLTSLSFLVAGPGITPLAMLQREVRFGVLSANEARSTVVGVVVSIALAALGIGAASLILGQIARRAFSSAQAQLSVAIVLPRWDWRSMATVLRTGGLAAIGGMMFIAKANAAYLVLGARLTAAEVGYYSRAYALGVQYQAKIGLVLLRVAFPSYARARNASDMFHMRKRFARAQMAVTIPLLGVFVAVAPLLVPLVFGERWSASAEPAQILAITAAAGLITNGTAPMVLATGRTGYIAVSNLIDAVLFVAVVYSATSHGLITVCWAVSAYNVVSAAVQTYYLLGLQLRQPVGELLVEVLAPLSCIAPTTVLGLLLLPGPEETSNAVAAGLIVVTSIVGLGSYVLLYRAAWPTSWADVAGMARRLAPRRAPAAAPAKGPV